MPRTVGAALSERLATLHEMQTIYGVGDVYDLLELAGVDAHNRYRAHEIARRDAGRGQ